jgi:ribulose kinase
MADFYLIAHDLGTSGTKAALTDLKGCVLATAERNYPVYYSADGGAEQDPQEWWQAIVDTTQEMMAKSKVSPQQIAGMSMSAQMVGTVPVDQDGNPLRRVMIWLDSRAEKEAAYLREVTQLPFIGGKAPSAKVLWIKQNEPEVYARTYKMLDCKDYLQFRMTGVYGTDYTLSSATTMFNPWEMGLVGGCLRSNGSAGGNAAYGDAFYTDRRQLNRCSSCRAGPCGRNTGRERRGRCALRCDRLGRHLRRSRTPVPGDFCLGDRDSA